MLGRTRREFARKYCLHPNAPEGCSKNIISAHSVQKALLKKFISTNGHVIQIKASAHVEPVGLLAKPEYIGINNATTFSGFCGKHDTELFRPLECTDFCFSHSQIALLGYRAVCRELYQKEAEIAAADSAWSYCSVNPDITAFAEKSEWHQTVQLARRNARINLTNAKNCYSEMLSDDSELRYYGIEFSESPVYFNSVSFLPEWDFEGTRLQDLGFISDYKPICFSAWAAGERAVAVFCWHNSASHICIPFIDSLRRSPPERLVNRILSMAFEVSENVVFRSDWWEALAERDRQLIVNRAFSGVGEFERTSDSLKDDGLKAIASKITAEHVGYCGETTLDESN
jgi:hypothetical protein